MHTFFANTRLMLTLAILITLAGLLLSYVRRDFTWLARTGALVVTVGITLLSRASVIHEDIQTHVLITETGLSNLNPAHYKEMGEPVPEWVYRDLRTRAAVGVWGPFVTFVGTLIWGFGDLLNKLFT